MKYFLEHILIIGFQFWEPPRGALHQSNLDFLSLTLLMNTLVLGLNIENTAFLYLLKFPVSFSNLSWTKWVFITYVNSMWTFCHRLNRHSIVKHLLQFFKECDTKISICHIIWTPYFNWSWTSIYRKYSKPILNGWSNPRVKEAGPKNRVLK